MKPGLLDIYDHRTDEEKHDPRDLRRYRPGVSIYQHLGVAWLATVSLPVDNLKGAQLGQTGRLFLGDAIATIIAHRPSVVKALAAHSLSLTPIVQPHVVVQLGELKIYAVATTLANVDLAVKQAFDRLCTVLAAEQIPMKNIQLARISRG